MSIFSKLADLAGGNAIKEIRETVMAYFPPDMTAEKKAQLDMDLGRLALERDRQAMQAQHEAQVALTEQISALEGTAADLRAVPVLGPILIFLRGAQRPVWGFATLWMDWQWVDGKLGVLTVQQEYAMVAITLLVLGFLFGERAIINILPVLDKLLDRFVGKAAK